MLASSGLSGADAPSLGECASCWGAHIHGGATCVPQFVPGKHNFKNKFCHNCKQSIMVPADRICTLTTELAARFLNKRSEGFWNHAPASMGGGQYRILNNTASCLGPWLALFREQPPPFDWSLTYSSSRTKIELGSNQTTSPSRSLHALTFLMLAPAHMQASTDCITAIGSGIRGHTHPSSRPTNLTNSHLDTHSCSQVACRPALPETWINEDGYVRLCIAKGTLVPAKTLRCGQPQASKPIVLPGSPLVCSPTPPIPPSRALPSHAPHTPTGLRFAGHRGPARARTGRRTGRRRVQPESSEHALESEQCSEQRRLAVQQRQHRRNNACSEQRWLAVQQRRQQRRSNALLAVQQRQHCPSNACSEQRWLLAVQQRQLRFCNGQLG